MTDKELRKAVTEFRDGILQGRDSYLMCAAVCWSLQGFLSLCGVETKVISGDLGFCNHVWLELPDGRIIDPTIDQFSQYDWCPKEKVYIGEHLPFYVRPMEDNDPIYEGNGEWSANA